MTIYAQSSGRGRAAIAVIRVSGPQAGSALRTLTGRALPPARRASLRRLTDPKTGAPIDQALVLWFPSPASETGEDLVEFHVHGGEAVREALFEALSRMPGLEPAAPGAFARQAFRNGKLDLTKIEGLADVVDAVTEAQRRQALRQLDGQLGQLYERWREALLGLQAKVEGEIDFAEDGGPQDVSGAIRSHILGIRSEITQHLADGRRGERLRDGLNVVILGAPNVGKSTLLNALARRDVAMVSDIPGTTRDVLEVALDLDGYPVTLIDTAGLRQAADILEAEGIRRALRRAETADLRIVLVDALAWPHVDQQTKAQLGPDSVLVVSRADLNPDQSGAMLEGRPVLSVSARTGRGVEELVAMIAGVAKTKLDLADGLAPTRARHRQALEQAAADLGRAIEARSLELLAEDLRLGIRALGRITGRVDVEDMLDRLFAEFCIGK
jgi:tRNA modification GTPase